MNALKSRGVDLSLVRRVQGPTGTAVILLQPSGENSIIIVGGANTADWTFGDDTLDVLGSAGCVLLQREIPQEMNIAVATEAWRQGREVMMDAGGVEGPLPPEILECLSLLRPNAPELARLTNLPTDTPALVKEAAQKLLDTGVKSVLVKLGANGSLYVDKNDSIYQNAFKVDRVVDTTGAGDCFTAAFAVSRLEGKSVKEAMQFASAAAAVCVQRMGAMTSLPSKEDTLQFLESVQ
eukprot:TRINITY_DN87448_c0_g1_i3.p2 TRINITY_DN87448_c0_g1~~TRINITY_DN87448_c0_g1_i3.p2  ORF type:complete len:237 (-),score=50.97 TRINITY_DN87448_c0_g1_i3:157-867(-)